MVTLNHKMAEENLGGVKFRVSGSQAEKLIEYLNKHKQELEERLKELEKLGLQHTDINLEISDKVGICMYKNGKILIPAKFLEDSENSDTLLTELCHESRHKLISRELSNLHGTKVEKTAIGEAFALIEDIKECNNKLNSYAEKYMEKIKQIYLEKNQEPTFRNISEFKKYLFTEEWEKFLDSMVEYPVRYESEFLDFLCYLRTLKTDIEISKLNLPLPKNLKEGVKNYGLDDKTAEILAKKGYLPTHVYGLKILSSMGYDFSSLDNDSLQKIERKLAEYIKEREYEKILNLLEQK